MISLITSSYRLNSTNQLIIQVGRVFANGPGDLDSIPCCVILKTFKMVVNTALLHTQQYKLLSRGKWSNPGKGVTPFSIPRCSSYGKESLQVTLDYSRQLYLLSTNTVLRQGWVWRLITPEG